MLARHRPCSQAILGGIILEKLTEFFANESLMQRRLPCQTANGMNRK